MKYILMNPASGFYIFLINVPLMVPELKPVQFGYLVAVAPEASANVAKGKFKVSYGPNQQYF